MRPLFLKYRWLFLIFVLALLVRGVIFYGAFGINYFGGIAAREHDIANSLVEGKGFSEDGINPQYHELPGYPIFLAPFFFLLGQEDGLFAARIVQMILSAFGVFIVFSIGNKFFGRATAYGAALLWAVWISEAFISTVAFHDSLMGIMLLLIVYFFVLAADKAKIRFFGIVGLAIGITSIIRSDFILLPLIFFPALLFLWKWNLKRSFSALLLMVMVAGIVLLPWGIRNSVQFSKFTLVRDVMWQGVWEGFGEFKNPVHAVLSDTITFEDIQREYPNVRYDTPEYQRILKEKSIRTIKEYPGWYAVFLLKRLGSMMLFGGAPWISSPFDDFYRDIVDSKNISLEKIKDYIRSLVSDSPVSFLRGLPTVLIFHLFSFMFGGVGSFVVRKERRMQLFFWVIIGYGIFAHLPIYWEPRYLVATEATLVFPLAVVFVSIYNRVLLKKDQFNNA